MIPDMDFMDLGARQETLNTRGEPILLQLCAVPAYALTVHKTQALSIKHLVLGSLEGVFALGQVYVLISRVTDPQNFYLLGVPPRDLLEDVASALIEQGISVDEFFETARIGLFFSWGWTCFFSESLFVNSCFPVRTSLMLVTLRLLKNISSDR